MKRSLFLVAALALTWACDSEVSAPSAAPEVGSPEADVMPIPADLVDFLGHGMLHRARPVTALSYNIYIGADVDRVLSSPPEEFEQRVQEALAMFIATDFGERSGAIADQILAADAHVVGLQEVYVIGIQGITGLPDMTVDFLEIMMAQLAARGLDYDVVAQETTTQLMIPVDAGGISLVDSDALLVRGDLPVSNPAAVVYQTKLTVPFGPTMLDLLRGYTAADVEVGGTTYRVVNTHLESQQPVPQIQQGQATELIADLAGTTNPIIVMGDLNSGPADTDAAAPYHQLRAAHYADVWFRRVPRGRPYRDPGFTCCQAPDLMNATSELVERIDLIMVRNDFDFLPRSVIGAARVELLGEEQADRTASGLWPSDHAGVVATLRLPRREGMTPQ